jgi:hypothetical protein
MTEPTSTTTNTVTQLDTPPPGRDDGDVVTKPKPRQIQKTASGMQKWQLNKFDATNHARHVFKKATSFYARELEKGSDGLSSYQISKKVKLDSMVACLPECSNDTPTLASYHR